MKKWINRLVKMTFTSGEEPTFEVVNKIDDYELREYETYMVARVEVMGSFEAAGSNGFHILADYIGGNNRSKTKIDMTAPVAMSKDRDHYQVEFTMPKKFKKGTLPEPNDARVKIIEVPAQCRAVYRYSAYWSEEDHLKHKNKLIGLLQEMKMTPIGETTFARFDPPFIPSFLRHNEVWIEVKPDPKASPSTTPQSKLLKTQP
jgi:hypothetical protein